MNSSNQPGKSLRPGALALIIKSTHNKGKIVTIISRPKFIRKVGSRGYLWESVSEHFTGALTTTDDAWIVEGDLIVDNLARIRTRHVNRTVINAKSLLPLGDDDIVESEETNYELESSAT